MAQPHRTSSNLLEPLQCRDSKVCRGLLHEFGVVRLYRTCLLTGGTGQCRESKVCRGLSHAFAVVRLYRTFSNHIFTRGSRCVWYLYTCSGWFIRSELPRTFSNHFSADKARCAEVFRMSSGWSTIPNFLEPHLHRGTGCVGYLYASSGWFNHSELPRTTSVHR